MFCHLYCFAAATQGKFFIFKIQIFMLLKLESESGIRNPDCKKSALESGIQIRRFFGRIAIPDKYNPFQFVEIY